MIVVGSIITWPGAPEVLGVVEKVEAHRRIVVLFDDGERRTLTIDTVEPKLYSVGDVVQTADGHHGFVRSSSERDGLKWYEVETIEGIRVLTETHLRPHVDSDPAALLAAGKLSSPHDFQVRTMATRALCSHESDSLSTLGNARVELREHQVGVLHRVATSYPHRFLLADEVGLGKTIEAGLILKELKARRMADRVLIIVPAGLRRQWQFEMLNKFNERFAILTTQTVRYLTDQGSTNPWREQTHVICSHDFAARPDTRHTEIAQAGWDLIIIDEAHHVRRNSNNTTLLYRLAQKLTDPELDRDQSMLLLTATPMQLEREELYALVELLDPALFPSVESFSRHVDGLPGLNSLVERVRRYGQLSENEKDEVCSETADYLDMERPTALGLLGEGSGRETVARELAGLHKLSDVMLRNRKSVVGGFKGRHAETIWVDLTDEERAFYDAVTDYTRLGFAASRRERNNAVGFLMTTFQKLLASSTYALAQSLNRRIAKLQGGLQTDDEGFEEDEMEEAGAPKDWLGSLVRRAVEDEISELEHLVRLAGDAQLDTKAAKFIDALQQIYSHQPDERVLVFTQSRDTQEYLARLVGERWPVGMFYGGMKDLQKDDIIYKFQRGEVKVLISTEAGGEGRNFQFAHILFNYDLPWNPMKVEQRIGRVDRIGQMSDIFIYNLACKGTIEERVIDVLQHRIHLFEQTVGGLDPILGDIETSIRDIVFGEAPAQTAASKRLGIDLEQKVGLVREREEQLADLIMDSRSFGREYVKEILGQDPAFSREDLRRVVLKLLGRYRSHIQQTDETTWQVSYNTPFFTEFGEQLIDVRGRGKRYEITFSSERAREEESLEFFAFGHPVVDALVAKATEPGAPGCATRWEVAVSIGTSSGLFFIYELTYVGFSTKKELHPVFIDSSGSSDPQRATALLEACRQMDGDLDVAKGSQPSVREAKSFAEGIVHERLRERGAALEKENQIAYERESEKLEAFYAHRQAVAQEKFEGQQKTLERIEALPTDDDSRRILPALRARARDADESRTRVRQDQSRRLEYLRQRAHVDPEFRLLAVAAVVATS